MSMHPSTSQCGTSAFNHPTGFPEFCFVTIQSIELLSLTHYNFIVNDTLKIRFTTKFTRFSGRKQASIKMQNNNLVSEFTWLIPSLEAKVTTNDKPKLLSSEEFYSNGQG